MSYVVEVNNFDELDSYQLLWNSLLPQTPGATFFHSLEWLRTYWKHYGHGQKLRVLIVHSGDEPVGILPLCIRTERYKVGNLRVLTYPLHDWGTFYSPIGANLTATLLAGLRHIRQTRRDWDMLDLRWVNLEGHDQGRTAQAMLEVGLHPHEQPLAQAAMVELPKDWETFLAQRKPKWRTNFRRYERRLADRGEVTHLRYRPQGEAYGDGDPRWDLFETCLDIARRSWQGSSQTGTTLSHPTVEPFVRDVHEMAAKKGMLDLNLLQIAGVPVAFAYNYQYQGRMQGLRIGFDKDRAPDGAGNVLYAYLVRNSLEEFGDTEYDMGVGSLEAKKHFWTRVATSYRFTHFPMLALRAQALRAKRVVREWWGEKQAEAVATETATAQDE